MGTPGPRQYKRPTMLTKTATRDRNARKSCTNGGANFFLASQKKSIKKYEPNRLSHKKFKLSQKIGAKNLVIPGKKIEPIFFKSKFFFGSQFFSKSKKKKKNTSFFWDRFGPFWICVGRFGPVLAYFAPFSGPGAKGPF